RERKLSGSTGTPGGVASYQPFSASQEPPPPEEKPAPKVKYLYDSFVTSREKGEEKTPRPHGPGGETPAPGTPRICTLQVTGPRISEETIRRRLAAYEFTFTQEPEDEKAFLTFESTEAATQANTALDGLDEGWRVTVARRPPQQGSWAPQPTPRNPPPKDAKRSLVTYDDIFD
ncbi:putative Negative elongation factor E, partial [Operophtera brumata]